MVKEKDSTLYGANDPRCKFFKVYFPDISSAKLKLPVAFSKRFHGSISSDVTLIDSANKIWPIALEKTEHDLFLRNGWEEFTSQHGLNFEDFVFFKFDGKSQFVVTIMAKDGCLKEKASLNNGNSENQEQIVNEKIKAVKRVTKATKSSKVSNRALTVERLRQSNMVKYGSLVEPKYPHFVSKMTTSSRSAVPVPKSVLKECNMKLDSKVKLADEDGKIWPVSVKRRKLGGQISLCNGWIDYQKSHKLNYGDILLFELIGDEGNRLNQIQVQVIHHSAEAKCLS